MNTFVERTNQLLKEKGLTQKQLSAISNITEASLSRYLSGASEPRIDIVKNLAKALGVSPSYLIGESDDIEIDKPYEQSYIVLTRNKNKLSDDEKAKLIKVLFEN